MFQSTARHLSVSFRSLALVSRAYAVRSFSSGLPVLLQLQKQQNAKKASASKVVNVQKKANLPKKVNVQKKISVLKKSAALRKSNISKKNNAVEGRNAAKVSKKAGSSKQSVSLRNVSFKKKITLKRKVTLKKTVTPKKKVKASKKKTSPNEEAKTLTVEEMKKRLENQVQYLNTPHRDRLLAYRPKNSELLKQKYLHMEEYEVGTERISETLSFQGHPSPYLFIEYIKRCKRTVDSYFEIRDYILLYLRKQPKMLLPQTLISFLLFSIEINKLPHTITFYYGKRNVLKDLIDSNVVAHIYIINLYLRMSKLNKDYLKRSPNFKYFLENDYLTPFKHTSIVKTSPLLLISQLACISKYLSIKYKNIKYFEIDEQERTLISKQIASRFVFLGKFNFESYLKPLGVKPGTDYTKARCFYSSSDATLSTLIKFHTQNKPINRILAICREELENNLFRDQKFFQLENRKFLEQIKTVNDCYDLVSKKLHNSSGNNLFSKLLETINYKKPASEEDSKAEAEVETEASKKA
ncbi:uncharacterized protein ASCRUDRAFT_6162 [Ascoidea rubescens DSM 1968]|uniref:Uncharacterized protein n=1 Tax=Ascoidea rubescens DSM 1968 TaxID=1344418 RepID=A0A1D2VRU0_9ASCO|nr:hypothetical protein ASCRUDRAFT_6162 [Ascoidea rubescens DSM 1968]ODV64321.1 hypothetical protein ASCRUDRAFT_6162 [Ascoidea rubescens DSM 1968]